MKRILAVVMIAGLAACGSNGAPDEPSSSQLPPPASAVTLRETPLLAFDTGDGAQARVRWVRGTVSAELPGSVQAITPNGSLVVNALPGKGDPGGPVFYDVTKTKPEPEPIGDRYANTDQLGFGDGLILTVRLGATGATLRGFDAHFTPVRTFSLPGESHPDGSGTSYGPPISLRGDVFAVRTEHTARGEVESDELIRLDREGKIRTFLRNKHLRQLSSGPDRKTLAALTNKGVVTLDAATGSIVATYGLPPACRRVKGGRPCVVRLEGRDGAVVARTRVGSDEFSTWQMTGRHWRQAAGQRDRQIAWQSHDGRLEGPANPNQGLSPEAIQWVERGKSRRIEDSDRASRWYAPGPLTQP